ncbi:hypothetical protein A9Q90_03895 [Gammaproteobacteria bacterium 54_18_T64]|nr:hypothetical protein A9Q90_03895 [Gammaproteobacteria bacterium 54_18_T64]
MSIIKNKILRVISISLLWAVMAIPAAWAAPGEYDGIVVFGASFSDSGNGFVLLSKPEQFGFDESCELPVSANVPPFDSVDEFFVPASAYAMGGHHFTNGATWVEALAKGTGLSGSVRPALRNVGGNARNYAVGGARALEFPCRFNLSDQLLTYLNDFSESSADTLFIIDMGGNDLRDIMVGAVAPDQVPIILGNIAGTITTLYQHGARNFLLVNVADFGQVPSVQILDQILPQYNFPVIAKQLANGFNQGLLQLQANLNNFPGMDIRIFDLYSLLESILEDPAAYALTETAVPCITPNSPPFVCKKANDYLFWDGLHVTKVVHKVMAEQATGVLMAP